MPLSVAVKCVNFVLALRRQRVSAVAVYVVGNCHALGIDAKKSVMQENALLASVPALIHVHVGNIGNL